MAAQKGNQFLVKLGNDASPEVFTSIGGFRTNRLSINDALVDVTTKSSAGHWREALRSGGIRSVTISGDGVFIDDTQFGTVLSHIMGSGPFKTYQVVVPGLGTFEGQFMVSTVELDGAHNDAVTKTLTLESAGAVTFTTS